MEGKSGYQYEITKIGNFPRRATEKLESSKEINRNSKKNKEAIWQKKKKSTSQLVLALPRREGKFRIETDASGHAIGRVLSQEQE